MSEIKFSGNFPKEVNQLMYDLGFREAHKKSIESIKEYISELDHQFDLGKKIMLFVSLHVLLLFYEMIGI